MAKANPQKKAAAVAKKKSSSTVKHTVGASKGKCYVAPTGAVSTILNKAAALKSALGQESLERKKLSALTGIQGKSTIANALTKLKNEGWMIVTPDSITITESGMTKADPIAVQSAVQDIPTTNAAFHEQVKKQYKLKPKAIELFDSIQDGNSYEKEKLAKALGMKVNSTFANLLTSLKKFGIIEFDRKTVRLTDDMMPFEPRQG